MICFIPKTITGKWSVGLILAMFILFFIGGFSVNLYSSVPAGDSILSDISGRPALALSMLAALLCGVSAFVSGVVAIIKNKERAILVFISSLIGLLLILFLLGEILAPH